MILQFRCISFANCTRLDFSLIMFSFHEYFAKMFVIFDTIIRYFVKAIVVLFYLNRMSCELKFCFINWLIDVLVFK